MTQFSSNTPFTSDQLDVYFPTDTTANTIATQAKAEQLLSDGFIDHAQYAQVASLVGTYIDSIAEDYQPVSATVNGTTGTTHRSYVIVPTYPFPSKTYDSFKLFPNAPPQGFPIPNSNPLVANQNVAGGIPNGRSRLYGKMSTARNVTTSNATLDETNYIAVVMPAASADFPGVKFDLLVQDGGSGDYNAIAFGVAAGATVNDKGLTRVPYAMGTNETLPVTYAHAEVGVDTVPSTHIPVYGPNTVVPVGFIT